MKLGFSAKGSDSIVKILTKYNRSFYSLFGESLPLLRVNSSLQNTMKIREKVGRCTFAVGETKYEILAVVMSVRQKRKKKEKTHSAV